MERSTTALRDLDPELLRYPLAVTEALHSGGQALAADLTQDELRQWAGCGVAMAHQGVRAWEAALEYFRVSPQVLESLTFAELLQWAQGGAALCDHSPWLSAAYFRATPGVVTQLTLRHLEQWGKLGERLYQGTWKSGSLAAMFLEASPALLEHLTFAELQRLATFEEVLAPHSYDLAAESLLLVQQVFPRLGDDREAFLGLATALAETNWRELRRYFEVVGKTLPRVGKIQRLRYLVLVEFLVRDGMTDVAAFLERSSEALGQVNSANHGYILSLAETLSRYNSAAILEFLRQVPQVLNRVGLNRLELWFDEGVRALQEHSEGGLAYFRLESIRSTAMLDVLSSGVELDRVKEVLRMYCRALSGAQVDILPTRDLVRKGIGWTAEEAPTTEGRHIFLPQLVDRYPHKDANYQWLKVVATHQVAHLEFSSFTFEYDKPSTLFRDLRVELAQGAPGAADELLVKRDGDHPPAKSTGPADRRTWLTDLERFFDLFRDRKLALDVFTVAEDGRVDARVRSEYAGLRLGHQQIQQDALLERPAIEELPAREALMEFLVRLSLRQRRDLLAPRTHVLQARAIARVARRLMAPKATVEDTAEATLRIYGIIARIPNEQVQEGEWEELNLDAEQGQGEDSSEEDMEATAKLLGAGGSQAQEKSGMDPREYESPRDVEFRGDFKPELTQLLLKLREEQEQLLEGALSGESMTRGMVEELLANSAELATTPGEIRNTTGLYASNLMREAGMNLSDPYASSGTYEHVEEEGGPLETTEPQTFLYDEWDFRADDYKPRWCLVREKVMVEGTPEFYRETLQSNASMLSQLRRQFEQLAPESFRKIRRQSDGEDFDLDAVVDAIIDKRLGIPPSDKLYWRRNKVTRDVAVVFLLDMSASTAEAIDEARRGVTDDWDAPNDPVERMLWLRVRRGEGGRRTHKRIIDLEKESIVLLVSALEAVGDQYGIYGFSGYGRENVEFYVIKDIEEQFSEQVTKRIESISPLQATRMGPAIRHATAKLALQEARTKLLFLISDGRPQDRGYSREGVEKEYAVHDTRMALHEARRRDITPFCLTVDRQGHDYLRTMCQDMGYEVLANIQTLPQRLPFLYRTLTL